MQYISPLTSPVFGRPGPRSITLLGSTGSIGTSALRVLAKNPEAFTVTALAGARNVAVLARQAMEFHPPYLGVLNQESAAALRSMLPADYRPQILVGAEGYTTLATLPEADCVLAAQVGAAGLIPALAAAQAGKILCLANKEALILAGHLFRRICHATGAVILPVDSEHNALFQAMRGHDAHIERLILTASGGPFRAKSLADIEKATPTQALAHPNWSMGAKISIDSATMMNKGLEIIEAVHLYGMPSSAVDVLVHPESIVHSLVEYSDGSHLAHLSIPDMEIPIGYCLGYPSRLRLDLPRLDLASIGSLTFTAPDTVRFPCLSLARQALDASPSHVVALNAANEIAVQAFLEERLSFPGIAHVITQILNTHQAVSVDDAHAISELDGLIRIQASQMITEGRC